ncbi:hypothetical protein GUJ93_ZPchr0005g15512 [Zizania palustris]|uniref:Uncharacterized protein n=1 Tax=Zizania palustris TaxID=103762 RepID=A0A8J5SLZ9_ZIZPA|nr:hypothetical protein GUJ93_ZPchr0005g15512 [Zizania palustris]
MQTPAMTMLGFAVRRRQLELETLRVQVQFVHFYRAGGQDAAGVIQRALAAALVPYYPLAGRVREVEARKQLVVDCTGEGVLFVEADADVRLEEVEDAGGGGGLRAPFPCMDQLLFDVEGSGGVLSCPLLLVQVTRLLCGGFVFALCLNHTICDAIGISQFLLAVSEHARGLPAPAVQPSWFRELLEARNQPESQRFLTTSWTPCIRRRCQSTSPRGPSTSRPPTSQRSGRASHHHSATHPRHTR